jgi:hypothetical protein
MIICNVCQIEKEDKNFQTYWHSTQQKTRVRKQCTECLYKIRLKRKNPDKLYKDNPNYKKCTKCETWKPLEEYYRKNGDNIFSRCKECEKEKERTERRKYRIKVLEENCGSEKVNLKPNHYADEYQRNCTFSLLEALGYIYNEEFGVWEKPGWKEVIEGKIVFPKILTRNKTEYSNENYDGNKAGNWVTEEMYYKIFELRAKGYTYQRIGYELNIGITTVCKYLKGIRKNPKWRNTSKSEK